MNNIIYMDNAATTRPCAEAVAAMYEALRESFGNPSSLHGIGYAAEKVLEAARSSVSELLGAKTGTLLFTSGGTESNNTALFGTLYSPKVKRLENRNFICTAGEHPSVLAAFKHIEKLGFEVRIAPLCKNGSVDADALTALVDDRTAFVSCMHVNNETGAVNDIVGPGESHKNNQSRYGRTFRRCTGRG